MNIGVKEKKILIDCVKNSICINGVDAEVTAVEWKSKTCCVDLT